MAKFPKEFVDLLLAGGLSVHTDAEGARIVEIAFEDTDEGNRCFELLTEAEAEDG
jgi:hypothetical protein